MPSTTEQQRRRRAAYAACSLLIGMNAAVWPAPMNLHKLHGPQTAAHAYQGTLAQEVRA